MSTKLVVGIMVTVGCIIVLSGANAVAGCYPDNTNPPCEGNLDYDCDVDGSDAALFKSDFGRSGFTNSCPSNGPAPVGRTGQTTSYHPFNGEDGDLQMGVVWPNPRFTINIDNNKDGDCNDVGETCDGTVTDNLTGLIWLRSANCLGLKFWDEAVVAARELSSGHCELSDGSSVGDWRLPNRFELESLLDLQYWEPALPNTAGTGQWTLNNPFKNLDPDGYYWSSTTFASNDLGAWYVDLYNGYVDSFPKSTTFYVWPVRGGQ